MVKTILSKRAWQLAEKAAISSDRGSVPLTDDPMSALIVLPSQPEEMDACWSFIDALRSSITRPTIVTITGETVNPPARYISKVKIIPESRLARNGLPKPTLAKEIWSTKPVIAIDLNRDMYLPAAYLVGGSPARARIGFHKEDAESFYDFMVTPKKTVADSLRTLREYAVIFQPHFFQETKAMTRPARAMR